MKKILGEVRKTGGDPGNSPLGVNRDQGPLNPGQGTKAAHLRRIRFGKILRRVNHGTKARE